MHTFIFDEGKDFLNLLLFPDLHELWMRSLVNFLFFFFGVYTYYLAKKGQKLILNNERQNLFFLLDELPAFVYLQSSDYEIKYGNRFFKELFGEGVNHKCYEVLNNHNVPCLGCPITNVLKTKKPYQRERKIPGTGTFQIFYYPFKEFGGDLQILALGIDITKLKKVELKLKKNEQNLRERINELNCLQKFY